MRNQHNRLIAICESDETTRPHVACHIRARRREPKVAKRVISACSAGRLRRTIKRIAPESRKRSETMAEWKTDYIPGPPRIAVDHCGAGPLVIFMHGIGGNRSNWHDQLPEFGRHFHAAAWDGRG